MKKEQSHFSSYQILSTYAQKFIFGGVEGSGNGGENCGGSGPSKSTAYCNAEGTISVCCRGVSGQAIDFDRAECLQSDETTVVRTCQIT